jgi:exodeoxyribonuclease VII large subunit
MDFFTFHEQVRTKRTHDVITPPAPAPAPAKGTAKPDDILTVSQLTTTIEHALLDCLPPSVTVMGEVSNYKHHGPSGHHYFTLKDAHACIDCAMFKSEASRLKFEPGEGMELVATGNVGVHRARGKYQLYVKRLEPHGQGALELAFRQLCAKLEAEGLFAPERRKPLPAYPRDIVIVTSKETAAFQDMLKVLRKHPWLRLRLVHVPVQGDGAAEKIAAAIKALNRYAETLGGIDVILLGRGGGSLEDLWEFNEEIVARAVAASKIPIVTGIGHEVDVSVADLAADYHAHTPTEAAQVVVANWRGARQTLDDVDQRLGRAARGMLQHARERLTHVEQHEVFRRPLHRISQLRQRLDDRQRALSLAVATRLGRSKGHVHELQVRLDQCHPRHKLRLGHQRVLNLAAQLQRGMVNLHEKKLLVLRLIAKHLHAIGPEQVLRRGYTITTRKRTGAIVRSAADLRTGDKLLTRFADGTTESTVTDSRQPGLFE